MGDTPQTVMTTRAPAVLTSDVPDLQFCQRWDQNQSKISSKFILIWKHNDLVEDVHRNRVKGIQDGEQQYLVFRKRVVYLDFFWSDKRSSEMIAVKNGRDQIM